MNDEALADEGPLRMQFELSRNDDPSLYDDLVRFKKGTKRINRLRLLAHEGMVAQMVAQGTTAARSGPSSALAMVPSGHGLDGHGPNVTVTAGMFDGGVADE